MSEPKQKKSKLQRLIGKYVSFGNMDPVFFVIVIVIICFGLVMLFSASSYVSYTNTGSSTAYFFNQLRNAALGAVVMLVLSRISIKLWLKLRYFVFGFATFLLIIVLFMSGDSNGIKRWITIGSIQFQPSELAKFALILICAYIFSKYYPQFISPSPQPSDGAITCMLRDKTGKSFNFIKGTWFPSVAAAVATALFAGLVFMESHLSGCIIMFIIGVYMMFLGGVRKRWFVIGGIGVFALAAIMCFIVITTYGTDSDNFITNLLQDYMGERIIAWWDKDYEPLGARWQVNESIYAIGYSGIFGVGFGNSTMKYGYVSEPANDFIFAIICEELGLIGALAVVVLFILLVWRGIHIARRSKSRFGALIVCGIVLQVAVQAFLNIAVATDSIPNTGISLPFFSYGGTSLIVLMGEMGIIMSVSRSMNDEDKIPAIFRKSSKKRKRRARDEGNYCCRRNRRSCQSRHCACPAAKKG